MAKRGRKSKQVHTFKKKADGVTNDTGAPTKYKSEYCDEIIEFFNKEPYEDKPLEHYDSEGNLVWCDFKRVAVKLPTLVQFAKGINVSYPTVYNWQDKDHRSYHKEFLEAYTRAKEIQKDFLIQAGCIGVYNSHFTIFTAKNITDMRDIKDLNLGGSVKIVLEDEK